MMNIPHQFHKYYMICIFNFYCSVLNIYVRCGEVLIHSAVVLWSILNSSRLILFGTLPIECLYAPLCFFVEKVIRFILIKIILQC